MLHCAHNRIKRWTNGARENRVEAMAKPMVLVGASQSLSGRRRGTLAGTWEPAVNLSGKEDRAGTALWRDLVGLMAAADGPPATGLPRCRGGSWPLLAGWTNRAPKGQSGLCASATQGNLSGERTEGEPETSVLPVPFS